MFPFIFYSEKSEGDGEAGEEPEAWLGDVAEVEVVGVEKVVGLEIYRVLRRVPFQLGIDKRVWAYLVGGADSVDETVSDIQPERPDNPEISLGDSLVTQEFHRICRLQARLELLRLGNMAVAEIQRPHKEIRIVCKHRKSSLKVASSPRVFSTVWLTEVHGASKPREKSLIQSIRS